MKVPFICRSVLASCVMAFGIASAAAQSVNLPVRTSPVPKTTNGVPHVQINVKPSPALSAKLLDRVSEIPGVDIRDTVISLPGAKGFWIEENVQLARPEVIVGGREFAHMHPDGSLHASLPVKLAIDAVKAGWATPHPWAGRRPGWEGFVMVYTPGTPEELDVVLQLVVASYTYVTGRNPNE